MIFQQSADPRLAETILRCVQNAATATLTLTAASIGLNTPVIAATATDSLPSSVAAAAQNFVSRPATATSLVNNLLVGLLVKAPGTKAYLGPEEIGLAQVYGPVINAVVQRATAGAAVGALMIPDSLQFLLAVGGPVTAAATASAGHVEVPALGGHAILMSALATSSATETTTAPVFLRCM